MASKGTSARKLWFQIHKWVGLLLFLLIIPICVSGSLLVWHDWTDSVVNPQRYDVSDSRATLPVSRYVASAQTVLGPGSRIASVALPEEAGKPVVVTASPDPKPGEAARPGPPARYQVWLDPATAAVKDHADARTGVLRTLHVLHGSLMVPGVGRKIVGWVGWAMLASCLTGIWLWWPTIGRFVRGFRWRRGPGVNSNLHHQLGIWIAIPLAVLSFTGAYISFPDFFRGVEQTFAGAPQGKAGGGGPRGRRARPVVQAALTPDAVVAAAGGQAIQVAWPTEGSTQWTVTTLRDGAEAQVKVDDATAAVETPPPAPTTVARFMRQLHDGHGYNVVWQTIIFIGGIIPAILAITGLVMWWNARRWRADLARRKRRNRAVPQPAE